MFALLIVLFLTWLFVKMGIGIVKILFFFLACALAFFFLIHLFIPAIIFLGLIFLFFAAVRH